MAFRGALPAFASTALFLAALAASTSVAALRAREQPPASPVGADAAAASADEVKARCGACHPVPPADILPRAAWRDELVRMMLIQEGIPEPAGGNSMIPLPGDWIRLQRYFEAHAPDRLPDPEPWPAVDPSAKFTRRALPPLDANTPSSIANARFLDLDNDGKLDIVASDMRSGHVYAGLAKNRFALKSIARLEHPAHIEQVDLDKDGLKDLLVADLGSFEPADHQSGAIYWLRQMKDGSFKPTALAEHLARTADARAADFDGDGDLDIIVAIFGWRKTGNITLLENRTPKGNWNKPVFVPKTIDTRTGSIHVPVTDLNGDGKPDFVALLAQEHESIVAFLNTGNGLQFMPQTIYAAPHPNWGSSGIELVDLDKDGDLDVLYTHGDTFDDSYVKPYHGIQWLENKGTFPFTEHTLASMPGVQRAQAIDLDGDGDMDIVATAMIEAGEMTPRLPSLVWLEQVTPGVFERHTLEMGTPSHATLDLADYNGDGRPDILVGWFAFTPKPLASWLDVWENYLTR